MNFETSVEDRHKIAAILKVLWLFTTFSEFFQTSGFGVTHQIRVRFASPST